jgi:hypothetical protein
MEGPTRSSPPWDQALWRGPFARAFPQLGNLSFLVGFAVSAVVYVGLAHCLARMAGRVLERYSRPRRRRCSRSGRRNWTRPVIAAVTHTRLLGRPSLGWGTATRITSSSASRRYR